MNFRQSARIACAAAVFGIALSSASIAQQQPTPTSMLLARELVEAKSAMQLFNPLISGVIDYHRNLFTQTNPNLARELNEVAQQLHSELVARRADLEQLIVRIYAQHFTEQELKQAVVVDVLEGTPAERFLLQKDDLITHVNGQEIRDHDELLLHVGKLSPDASVRLTVERDGRSQVISIGELAKFWVTGKRIVTNPAPAWRGIRVDYVTASQSFPSWAAQCRVDPQGSVLVTEVEEDSPAWKEGLRPDMMISHVGSRRVATPKDFQEAVADQDGPVKLRLTLPPGERPVRTIEPNAS